MKITKNFWLHELVDKTTFERFGDFSQRFLDPDTVKLVQSFRERYGSTTVNNWRQGGNLQYRGFRPPNCSIGGMFSQHKYGRGFDLNCKDATPDEIREDIMANEELFLNMGLTRIEDGAFAPTWLHIDRAWTGDDKIHVVKP
jgi:hypothetical protein